MLVKKVNKADCGKQDGTFLKLHSWLPISSIHSCIAEKEFCKRGEKKKQGVRLAGATVATPEAKHRGRCLSLRSAGDAQIAEAALRCVDAPLDIEMSAVPHVGPPPTPSAPPRLCTTSSCPHPPSLPPLPLISGLFVAFVLEI